MLAVVLCGRGSQWIRGDVQRQILGCGDADRQVLHVRLSSVSCPSSGFCAAIDDAGNGQTFSDSSWTAPAQVSGSSLDSVSCASSSFCVAVNGDSYTFNGTSWSAATTIGNGESFEGVSCPSSSFCAAVGHNGSGAVFDGSSWSTTASIDPNGQGLSSVSCPSSSFCVAVDGAGNALTFNGSSWSAPASIYRGQGLSSVSCTSASFSVAVGGPGNALTFNGSTWSAPVSIDPNGHGLSSVSCSSASFCVAVDAVGDEITYTAGAAPPGSGQLSFSPSPLDFGPVQPGVISAIKSVKVRNATTRTISLAKLSLGSVSPAGVKIIVSHPTSLAAYPTSLAASGVCGKVLGAGATCKLTLQIKITAKSGTSGAFTTSLLVGNPASTLPLTGTIGGLSFSPSPLDFGPVQPGVISAIKSVKVRNATTRTISLAKLSLGSVSPAGVKIIVSHPTSLAAYPTSLAASGVCGKVLGAGATCKLTLQIKITAKSGTSGAFTTSLLVGNPASTLPLTGTIGGLSFSPSPLDFGPVQPGVISAIKSVKVRNATTRTISLAKLSLGSVSPAGVKIIVSHPTSLAAYPTSLAASGVCGKVLGAGATCKLTLQIKITAKSGTSGAFTTSLLVGNPASTLPLTGTIRSSRTH